MTEWSRFISKAIHWDYKRVIQVYAQITNAEKAEVKWFYEDLQDLLELTKKDVLFIIKDWNEKLGSQEINGVTGKFGLRVQNEAGQGLTEFCRKNTLVKEKTLFQQHKKWPYTWTSQMVNTKIRLSVFCADKDGEPIYTASKNKTWSWLWLRSSAPYYKIQA